VNNSHLYISVKATVLITRQKVCRLANSALLETYWPIGQLKAKDELKCNNQAQYGKAPVKNLFEAHTLEFGKGYHESNLRNKSGFFIAFPIRKALHHELSWTHDQLLSCLDSDKKRNYYLQEAIATNWNSRELQRQINTISFERVLKHIPEKTSKNRASHGSLE